LKSYDQNIDILSDRVNNQRNENNDNSGWLEMIMSGALLGTIYNSFLKKEESVVLEE